MASSPSSPGTPATPFQGHQLPPPKGSQLKWAVGGCLGRELLATETDTSRLNAGRQVPLHCPLAHGLGCETMHASKCDRSQRHATAWRHPAGTPGTLPEWGFHFWSISTHSCFPHALLLLPFPSSICSNTAFCMLPERNRANITWLTKRIWAGRGGGGDYYTENHRTFPSHISPCLFNN